MAQNLKALVELMQPLGVGLSRTFTNRLLMRIIKTFRNAF